MAWKEANDDLDAGIKTVLRMRYKARAGGVEGLIRGVEGLIKVTYSIISIR